MRVFVTGGTGWIGRHLLPLLVDRGADVVALVRRPDAALACSDAVETVLGDVTEPGLGLSDADREALDVAGLDHVFHLAAVYDLAADAALLERVNVEGTRHLLALLGEGFEGTLHHVSSIAVAGDHDAEVGEDELDLRQRFPTAYHRTKHASEKLVREAGLRFRVYRPAAVVGHSRTGEMPRIDGPYFMFRAVHALRGRVPTWIPLPGFDPGRVNMVPVDFVAAAIDAIAFREGFDDRGFHLVDPHPPRFYQTFNLVADAAAAPRMVRWRPGQMASFIPGARNVAAQLGSLSFFRREWAADFGVPEEILDATNRHVAYATDHATAALEGTGVACPPQASYVTRLWDYYLRHLDPDADRPTRDRRLFGGKRAVVTGGSSGIGAALAARLGAAGAHVVLIARHEDALEEVAGAIREAGGRADCVAADLSDLDECDRAIDTIQTRWGPIDLLFNNAGKSIRRPLAESLDRFHDLQRVMQLNYFAPARLIRAVLPSMRERGTGHIVNTLSAGSHMPSIRFGAYTASKAALSQLSDVLAAEHLHEGIRVTNAYLHWVRTPMLGATGRYDDVPAMTPDEAASVILDGIAHRKQHVVRTEDLRRFALARVHPSGFSRIVNVLYRIYADDPDDHPELALDRAILKKLVRGRLV